MLPDLAVFLNLNKITNCNREPPRKRTNLGLTQSTTSKGDDMLDPQAVSSDADPLDKFENWLIFVQICLVLYLLFTHH